MCLEKDRFVDKVISGSKTVLPSFFVTYNNLSDKDEIVASAKIICGPEI